MGVSITARQHSHLAPVQGLLHLQVSGDRLGRGPGAILVAVAPASCATLAVLLVSAGTPAAQAHAVQAHPARAHAKVAPARCPGKHVRPRRGNLARIERATLCLVNEERASYGLSPLVPNRELGAVASGQVTSMIGQDYFSDDTPTGQTPMSIVAVTRYTAHTAQVAVGENIAWGTGPDATPARVVAQWLASPEHREVMLSDTYREAGVGVRAAVPAVLHPRGRGATYAMELGARLG